MATYTDLVQKLIKELSRLPGIGPRSAERIIFYLLRSSDSQATLLSELITQVKEHVHFCEVCNNLSENYTCSVCQDETRDKHIVSVVEEPKDVVFLEKCGKFNGVYHVLLGALSPLNGIGPKDLKIKELEEKVAREKIDEIIVATNFNADGEATALYLKKILKPYNLKITRIARGIPTGSNLEYVDQETLAYAIAGRQEV